MRVKDGTTLQPWIKSTACGYHWKWQRGVISRQHPESVTESRQAPRHRNEMIPTSRGSRREEREASAFLFSQSGDLPLAPSPHFKTSRQSEARSPTRQRLGLRWLAGNRVDTAFRQTPRRQMRSSIHQRADLESQRDSVPKPRVARHELPWVGRIPSRQPQRGCGSLKRIAPRCTARIPATTPLGLMILGRKFPKVARASQPWAERHNPFGMAGRQERGQPCLCFDFLSH